MNFEIRFPGFEEFAEKLLALLERIATALETGPHVPHEMRLRVGAPEKETQP